MSKLGPIRVILVKYNEQGRDDCCSILCTQFFQLGLICSTAKYKWDHVTNDNWMKEYVENDKKDLLVSHLDNSPNGFYEIVGDLHFESRKYGYEYTEYDTNWWIENARVQQIPYEQALNFDENQIMTGDSIDLMREDSTPLHPQSSHYMWGPTVINMYMQEQDILAAQAISLKRMNESYYLNHTEESALQNMNVQQLKDFIFMAMLAIDSESEKDDYHDKKRLKAIAMDEDAKYMIKAHKALFDPEEA